MGANKPVIGSGPGNKTVFTETQYFEASGAISRGQVVALKVSEGTSSYKIVPADSDGTNLDIVIGVADAAITSGEMGPVIISGYCDYVLTDGTVAVGDPLVPHTVAGEASVMAAGEEHLVFGHALSTDTGSTEYCDAIIFKRI